MGWAPLGDQLPWHLKSWCPPSGLHRRAGQISNKISNHWWLEGGWVGPPLLKQFSDFLCQSNTIHGLLCRMKRCGQEQVGYLPGIMVTLHECQQIWACCSGHPAPIGYLCFHCTMYQHSTQTHKQASKSSLPVHAAWPAVVDCGWHQPSKHSQHAGWGVSERRPQPHSTAQTHRGGGGGSKFDFLATRQCLGKLDRVAPGQWK